MDTGTIIMGTILIAIVVVPMSLLGRNGRKTKHKLLNLLESFANKENCKISEQEVCDDFAIGIDNENKVVFFTRLSGENYETERVNLSDIKTCKSNVTSRAVSFNGRKDKVVERLGLSFIPKNSNSQPVELEFFNAEKNTQLNGEFQALEKWQKIVSDQIQKRKK